MFSNEYVCQEVVRAREAQYQAEALGDHYARQGNGARDAGRGTWLNLLRKWMTARNGAQQPRRTSPTACEPLPAKN